MILMTWVKVKVVPALNVLFVHVHLQVVGVPAVLISYLGVF